MSDQMLAEVHALLTAIGTRDSLITYINGWTLFQNSEAGPYVGLYNTSKGKRDGRVYVYGFTEGGNERPLNHEFKKLPTWLKEQVLALLAKEQPAEAPRSETTEYIQQKNLLRKCQTFKVIRYKYESVDDEKKEPWRIVKCFDIGNGDNQRQSAQERSTQPRQQVATAKPTPPRQPAPEPVVVTPPAKAATPATNGASKPATNGAGKPAAGKDDADPKKVIIRTMFTVAKAVYGEAGAAPAMLKIGQAVAKDDSLTGLSHLTTDQLSHVDAILQLQQAGINEYGDIMEWTEALPVLLQEYGKESVYDLTPHQIAKLRKDITNTPADKGDIPF